MNKLRIFGTYLVVLAVGAALALAVNYAVESGLPMGNDDVPAAQELPAGV